MAKGPVPSRPVTSVPVPRFARARAAGSPGRGATAAASSSSGGEGQALPHDHVRGAVPERHQVRPEPGVEGTLPPRLQPLHEAADQPEAVLQQQPRVALPPLPVADRPQPSGHDAWLGDPAREAVELARRQQHAHEHQPQRGLDAGRAHVALDALECAGDGIQGPRRVQVQQLVRQLVVGVGHREAADEPAARRVAVRGLGAAMSSRSTGTVRVSPVRDSRQCPQRYDRRDGATASPSQMYSSTMTGPPQLAQREANAALDRLPQRHPVPLLRRREP